MAEKLTEVAATSPQHNQGGLTTGAPVTYRRCETRIHNTITNAVIADI